MDGRLEQPFRLSGFVKNNAVPADLCKKERKAGFLRLRLYRKTRGTLGASRVFGGKWLKFWNRIGPARTGEGRCGQKFRRDGETADEVKSPAAPGRND